MSFWSVLHIMGIMDVIGVNLAMSFVSDLHVVCIMDVI